jgi:hypothetical protein
MLIYIKNKAANDINSSKYNSRIKKHEYFYNMDKGYGYSIIAY